MVEKIEELIKQRSIEKANKNFSAADKIRDELNAMGSILWILKMEKLSGRLFDIYIFELPLPKGRRFLTKNS